ncbi:MAG: DUF1848 domain-containing protein [Clostridia bacterium]|nr:DUF1848 domain-containing protein [Clostridia bacterium]NCC42819.1 DUF1848 domain-containing protein [Clostridia bacterium]
MIINTGCRTDIPAYYSDWFYNRIKEGYVMVRNPYYPQQVSRYRLSPDVVDVLVFCTKNPEPMLERIDEIKQFHQFWFVTITPYGNEIEPNVPDKKAVMDSFKKLSQKVGLPSIGWRYDPIFISGQYSLEYHLDIFEKMARNLSGYVDNCVISFIDLYEKTKKNFPGVRRVGAQERAMIGEKFAGIGKKYGITIRSCCEGKELEKYGIDVSGCMTKSVMERAAGYVLHHPKTIKSTRPECECLLGNDIGMYNTCGHACIYCYANYDRKTVAENMRMHDPESPFLVGRALADDQVREAKQNLYGDGQLEFVF